MKVLLFGYIGKKNFGDDLLFQIAINRFKKIGNVELSIAIVESNIDPSYLKQYYKDLKILVYPKKLPLFLNKNFDVVFYIGGGVFFDYREKVSLVDYVKGYISTILRFRLAKVTGTKYMGIGLGIGPYTNHRAKTIHSQILSSFNFLGVRDSKSFESAILLNKGSGKVVKTNDLSIGIKLAVNAKKDSKEVIICSRAYKHKKEYEKHIDELLIFSEFLFTEGYFPHWVFLQEENECIYEKVRKGNNKLTVWNPNIQSINDFISIFNDVYCVVSSRMHSVYIAGLLKTPFIGIEIHQKVRFASELFTKEPIMISPLADIQDYKEAFFQIGKFNFNNEKFNDETQILQNVERDLLNAISSKCKHY